MTVNVELVEKAKAAVRQEALVAAAQGVGWDQGTWVDAEIGKDGELCGTTCCFAGHVLLASGEYRVGVVADLDDSWYNYPAFINIESGEPIRDSDDVPKIAQDMLGLGDHASHRLFFNFEQHRETYLSNVDSVIKVELGRS